MGAADLVFCCLGGGPLDFFATLLFVFAPNVAVFPELLDILPFLGIDLDLIVLVGAMTYDINFVVLTVKYFTDRGDLISTSIRGF